MSRKSLKAAFAAARWNLATTKLASAALAAALALGTTPVAAEEIERGQLLSAMCETCHGTDGHGAKPIKSINEQDVDDMIETMKAFASKEEPSTMMYRHAQGYTEEELKAMAEYLENR